MSAALSIVAAEAFNSAAHQGGWPAFCDATLNFGSSDLATLLEIWRQSAGTCGLPARERFSLRVLKPFLRNITIYEQVSPAGAERRYRVRLMGSTMAEVVGFLSGRYLDEAVPAPFLGRWYASLDATLDAGAPLRFLTRSDTNRTEFLVAEYFSAPMAGGNGSANMILAGAHFDGSRSWSAVDRETRRMEPALRQ
jgi:hypothetical protein